MKPVHFVKQYQSYQRGEIAGFDPKFAIELCKAGVGVPYEEGQSLEYADALVAGGAPDEIAAMFGGSPDEIEIVERFGGDENGGGAAGAVDPAEKSAGAPPAQGKAQAK